MPTTYACLELVALLEWFLFKSDRTDLGRFLKYRRSLLGLVRAPTVNLIPNLDSIVFEEALESLIALKAFHDRRINIVGGNPQWIIGLCQHDFEIRIKQPKFWFVIFV